jgi:sulfur-oxidizing protein SoxX
MRIVSKLLVAAAISGLISTSSLANEELVKQGEKIFNTKDLGNCLACHSVSGKNIDGPGSFGPVLTGLSFWDEKTLYDTVYDIYKARGLAVTAMPAYGTNGWLSDSEIKAVVAYLKTIN